MTTSTAPGKVILCGEHAVVYGQPAIAIPITSVAATATIRDSSLCAVEFHAPDLAEDWTVAEQPDHPLSRLLVRAAEQRAVPAPSRLNITLTSTIPIASGMGSGAALGAALVQALGRHWQHPFAPQEVAKLVFESERVYHGTPSGIDNTVVSWQRPLVFARTDGGSAFEPLAVACPVHLVIADTGVRCSTKITVARVRELWLAERDATEQRLTTIGSIVGGVRAALARGDLATIGRLLNRNQDELAALGVSSPELDRLIVAARAAGAAGAKLSGGGGGGVMLAITAAEQAAAVAAALHGAGARWVLQAELLPHADHAESVAAMAQPV